MIQIILGALLVAMPFIILTAVMWKEDGWQCVAFCWGVTLSLIALVGGGVFLMAHA